MQNLPKGDDPTPISAAFPYHKQRLRVLGREMVCVEVGQGDRIVLLHGSPTSSYVWRNVLPHLELLGRCIAPDLIGTGDSDKLLNSGPGSYRFVDHRRYRNTLIWGMLHAIRADYARLLYSVFLLVVGPGRWSVDALLARSKGTTARPVEPMNRQPEPGPMRI